MSLRYEKSLLIRIDITVNNMEKTRKTLVNAVDISIEKNVKYKQIFAISVILIIFLFYLLLFIYKLNYT